MVVVTLVTLGFEGNQIRRSELTITDERSAERVFTDLSWTLTLTLANLRAAQQAYVAAGQDQIYWTDRVSTHLETVRDSLDNLSQLVVSPSSIEALDGAAGSVADLERIDQRAREHADLQQPLLASDLIFTDGLELTTGAAAHVELARTAERSMRKEAIRATRAAQARMIATATGVGVLAVLLLAPLSRTDGPAAFASERDESAAPSRLSSLSLNEQPTLGLVDSGGEPPSDGTPSRETTTPAASASTGRRGPDAVPDSVTTVPMPDLRAAAALCTDLARLTDNRKLPELLARAATLMNASGLIIWIRGSGGHTLRPVLEHGYAPGFLARIGSIPEDGDNSTAAAYRDTVLQVVEGSDSSSGALAAPLLATDCCVGVLSAELRDGWESSDAVQATVTIIAAQLATLLPSDAPAKTAVPPTEAHG